MFIFKFFFYTISVFFSCFMLVLWLPMISQILITLNTITTIVVQVCITRVSKVPVCNIVHVEPASVDDWEILVSWFHVFEFLEFKYQQDQKLMLMSVSA